CTRTVFAAILDGFLNISQSFFPSAYVSQRAAIFEIGLRCKKRIVIAMGAKQKVFGASGILYPFCGSGGCNEKSSQAQLGFKRVNVVLAVQLSSGIQSLAKILLRAGELGQILLRLAQVGVKARQIYVGISVNLD